MSFTLMIAAGALTACGNKQDVASTQEASPKAHQYGQEIRLEGSLPRMVVSQSIKVPVSVRNTSNFNWTPSGDHPVRFAYHWFGKDRTTKVVHDGERTFISEDLPVGATAKLEATVIAPPMPGDYTLHFTFVQEGVAWFDDEGARPVDIPVTVESQ